MLYLLYIANIILYLNVFIYKPCKTHFDLILNNINRKNHWTYTYENLGVRLNFVFKRTHYPFIDTMLPRARSSDWQSWLAICTKSYDNHGLVCLRMCIFWSPNPITIEYLKNIVNENFLYFYLNWNYTCLQYFTTNAIESLNLPESIT